MDEGNIFDDIQDTKISEDNDKKENNETITISKYDLKEIVDNIKTKYIAEIDAIMLE